jgi:hypothetical protein
METGIEQHLVTIEQKERIQTGIMSGTARE